jgi:LysM repeat protein
VTNQTDSISELEYKKNEPVGDSGHEAQYRGATGKKAASGGKYPPKATSSHSDEPVA